MPGPLRPLLRFRERRPSAAALGTIRQVLDADEPFRLAVASEATETSVGRAGWLYLHRPDGWRHDFDRLVAAEADLEAQDRDRASERSAERRAQQLDELVSQLREELERARSESTRAAVDLDAERAARRRVEVDAADLRRRLDAAEQAGRDGVADLVESRRLADGRLEEIRALEKRVAGLERARARIVDPVSEALDRADESLRRLRGDLDAARLMLAPPDPGAGVVTGSPSAGTGDLKGGPGRVRRVPIRLERGALDGTFEATDQLLRTPEVRVVVDGYNVTMQGWPHLDAHTQRERLIGLLSGAAARTGARFHAVFDGDDDGRRPSVGAALAVRVHYTQAGVEADDDVIAMARALPPEVPVVVVSSDNRVRDGARASGANVVSSAALLEWDRR